MTLASSLKSRLKHSPAFPLLRRRSFHAYNLGAPKTGTLSFDRMFRDHYRTAHEPLDAGTMEYILAASMKTKSREELTRYLRWRDRELYLDMESSHPMVVFSDILVQLFPRAQFILTIREPRAWLDSIINQHLKYPLHRPHPAQDKPKMVFFRALHDHYYGRDGARHQAGEEILKEAGLYTLDGYLSSWAEHNQRVLNAIPHDRLLILRTERISSQVERIAAFLGVPLASINLEKTHAHKAPKRYGLLEKVDASLLQEKIAQHCTSVCTRLESIAPKEAEGLLSAPSV